MNAAFTNYIDLAQVALYVFWVFFAGLIYYLHRENKREGYPLVSDRSNERVSVVGYPNVPKPKAYITGHGDPIMVPDPSRDDRRAPNGRPAAFFPGAPLNPIGNPLLAGVGPGAWAERADVPDMTLEGAPKILPTRIAKGFYTAKDSPNPVDMKVVGADGKIAGVVTDAWVDTSEYIYRYFEVALPSGKHVLVPVNFTKINAGRRQMEVEAILSKQFEDVPALRNPNQVTMLEEEKICAYFGAGLLYATRDRMEPLF